MSKFTVERQWTLEAVTDINLAEDATDLTFTVMLPPNAVLVGGQAIVSTAFNGTTPKLTAVDNSASPISIFGNVDATAVAVTPIAAGAGTLYPAGATVTVGVSGSPTAGRAIVRLSYLILGRANELYTVGSFNN